MKWQSIEQTGRLLYNPLTKKILGVSWQNIDREEVQKEFRDGGVVEYSSSSTLEMFPVVVLGGGDTEWVACALGKENMAGAHCNHCRRSKKDFHLGLVCQQMEQVRQNRKRKFTPATITKRESKAEGAIAIKKERRS